MSGSGLPSLTTGWYWWANVVVVAILYSGCSDLTTRLGAGGGWRIWLCSGMKAAVLLPWACTCTPLGVKVMMWRSLDA